MDPAASLPSAKTVAGVSWTAKGYEVAVRRDSVSRHSFGLRETNELIDFLVALGPGTVAVIDSTNGMLDGRMMAAGVSVWRADPDVLPARPAFGAVTAEALSAAAVLELGRMTRLARDRGTQTGRESGLDAGIAESVPMMTRLMAEGRCITSGDPTCNEVALSFDDGPNPPYTDQVLEALARENVRATFFCVGLNAGGYPETVSRIAAEGHELGNHTWSHPFLPELTHKEFLSQVERTGDAIAGAAGARHRPNLFRPPYGSRNAEVAGWLAQLGSRTVLWDVEASDWAMPGADVIVQRVLSGVRPGSVILLHDGGGDRRQTVDALGAIIEGVREKGLDFVPVGELAPATS